MKKIKGISEIAKIAKKEKQKGKKVGLITGCFDIIHIGHIDLFKFAKKHCDTVVVGLENDQSIKISKGKQRPIFSFNQRGKVLSQLEVIDHIFKVNEIYNFGSPVADSVHQNIIKNLSPDFLITNRKADKYYKHKKKRFEKMTTILLDSRNKVSSSYIIQKLQEEM